MRVVAAPDKFKGTATAAEVASAICEAARTASWRCDAVPMADGGEGTLDALGGANRATLVSGPLGDPVRAGWRLVKGHAVIEMAAASGLDRIGGADENDPMGASTSGTGELISAALDAGARHVLIGMGGSATTDGGLGALRALSPFPRLRGVELVVACDVTTRFLDAAEVFAPQKGASASQVALLQRRLERLAQIYLDEHGVDVTQLVGGGAAGGLAGGLAAIGASLTSGFAAVAEQLELEDMIEGADLVITGEGFLDAQSFDGKVVGGVAEMAATLDVPVLAIAGEVYDGAEERIDAVSLVQRFGVDRARAEPLACVAEVVADHLSSW
ncbi:MAG: glycerate kinase [Acidimicrobiia bacterium]|nr:glycerate kinase [Acidimicrobiia bacterium]